MNIKYNSHKNLHVCLCEALLLFKLFSKPSPGSRALLSSISNKHTHVHMQSRFTVTYTLKGDHTQFNSSSATAALLSICVWIPLQRCLSWRLVVLKLWRYIWASVTASLRISLYKLTLTWKLTVIPVVIPLQFTKSSKHCDSSVMCNGVKHWKFDICICFGAETLQISERFLINCKFIEYFKENSALCCTPLSSFKLGAPFACC